MLGGGGCSETLVVTLVKSQVRYFVRDQDCIGRSCLDLGPEVKATPDIRCKLVRSACRTLLQKGCPRELPGYNAQIASRYMLSGVSVLHEPILTRTLPVPCPDATPYANRDATPYIP